MLAEVWKMVLGVHRVCRNDSFFELGGHSISAMRVVGRVSDLFGTELPVRLLLQFPTLSEFATQLDILLRTQLMEESAGDPNAFEELLGVVESMEENLVEKSISDISGGEYR
jgi:acyl carrier protein